MEGHDGTAASALASLYERMATAQAGERRELPGPFPTIDRLTGGLEPGSLVVVAGAPSSGKTSFSVECALAAAGAGGRASLMSLEEPTDMVAMRLLSSALDVDLAGLREGGPEGQAGWRRALDATSALSGLELRLPSGPVSLESVRAEASWAAGGDGCGLLVVDGLSDLAWRTAAGAAFERHAAVVAALRSFALETGSVVMVTTQAKDARAPALDDVRGARDVCEMADVVVLLSEAGPGRVRAEVVKDRHGRLGVCALARPAGTGRLRDLGDAGE